MMSAHRGLLFMSLLACFALRASALFLRPGAVSKISLHPHDLKFVGDTGHATNCGTGSFTLTWTPKVINPANPITLSVEYLAPHTLASGYINGSIFFHGDKAPFIGYENSFDCTDIKRYIFQCPIKKGFHVKLTHTFPDVHAAASYPGTYDLIAVAKNQDHLEMICLRLTVEIKQYTNWD